MVRITGEYIHTHPELVDREQYALTSILDGIIALCKVFGVPKTSIPAPMTPLSDSYLGDLYHLAEIDIAARKKAEQDAKDEAARNRRR